MTNIRFLNLLCAGVFICAAVIASSAQTLTTLLDFNSTDGAYPYASMVQGRDGNFYGTTYGGGTYGDGIVFRVTQPGTLTILYQFNGADGSQPYGALVQAADGNFYGATLRGGDSSACSTGCGTIFKITPSGTLTTLVFFDLANGALSYGGLIQASDGNLYGTTSQGGDALCNAPFGCGTVFRLSLKGNLTTIHIFKGYPTDGDSPDAGLVQARDGNLYGITEVGGVYNNGLVFKIAPGGALTELHSFCDASNCDDADYPSGALVQSTDGNFYGTTLGGGSGDYVCGMACGTVYKITPSGKLTILHNFTGTDGAQPAAGLVEATDGNFYGTTDGFATTGYGTVFTVTTAGVLTTLHSFCTQSPCMDGGNPIGGLLQSTNGDFYGGTAGIAAGNYGTVFSLSTGLGAFISLERYSGKVGQTGFILGQGLSGTTGVSLNGTPANFTIMSDTLIRATVPFGATTGYVTVTTSSETLKSNAPFRVTQWTRQTPTPSKRSHAVQIQLAKSGARRASMSEKPIFRQLAP